MATINAQPGRGVWQHAPQAPAQVAGGGHRARGPAAVHRRGGGGAGGRQCARGAGGRDAGRGGWVGL